MIERDNNHSITVTIVGILIFLTCAVLIVTALESARTSEQILSRLNEMRGTMGDAGYLPAEPRIEARK